jgi:hypothetical protein
MAKMYFSLSLTNDVTYPVARSPMKVQGVKESTLSESSATDERRVVGE